jgi:hypothetical protein
MKLNAPRYTLVRTQLCDSEWIFRESPEAAPATRRFDQILEAWQGRKGLTSELRKFLNRYPWHFDAMNHYAACKLAEGRTLDGFAFAQSAASIARNAFPDDFEEGSHQVPGGFFENRPFLRCLYQLMVAQADLGEWRAACSTGYQIVGYDIEDRMGARMELPKYLLKLGMHRRVIDLFEEKSFEDTFHTALYLYPLALLGGGDKGRAVEAIRSCLRMPNVAKYLLDPSLPQPEPEQPFFGITSGSELEGFLCASEYRPYWQLVPGALALLAEAAAER